MATNTQPADTVVPHNDVPHNQLPRGALIAAGILVAVSIALAGATRLEGGYIIAPPAAEQAESRALIFRDLPDRGIAVIDGTTGAPIADLAPGTHGFIRGMLRGLSRDRFVHGIGADVPFTLTRWSDGRYSLSDPATGSILHLAAYGFANVHEFAAFLPGPAEKAVQQKEARP
ncbi:photosynthetic complex assembly protein PuhC [Thalassobaculum sp. OXR-137]|uniref:photosynthetic complex assembly protein PuhC n=1 Tax=Thalassobaculum sp. OXR-137 TaxID=3100173 RepID=UPI002AC959D1|nr:photosynthetic complex assembly protein PuhC [Thalassobaculum sp. OXR-137]WPZ36822.1 photosynthetic complex assembly protein PuhC [Thalassobaculum sp. OXR-137]